MSRTRAVQRKAHAGALVELATCVAYSIRPSLCLLRLTSLHPSLSNCLCDVHNCAYACPVHKERGETLEKHSEYREKYGSVKLNVGWDENDYQLNIDNSTDISAYQRIFERNSQYGILHETLAPWNPLEASHARSSDDWGWEPTLWFTEGENIRQLKWNPWDDSVPSEIGKQIDTANGVGVLLNAYVYPILG